MRFFPLTTTLTFAFILFLTATIVALTKNELVSPIAESTSTTELVSPLVTKKTSAKRSTGTLMGQVLAVYNAFEDFSIIATPTPGQWSIVSGQSSVSGHFTIAVVGDSMVDVLQPNLPILAAQLKAAFPKASFTLNNFGVGTSSLENAISRLTNEYTYLGERKPAVLSTHPDIVVIESFAYNNFGPHQTGLDKQWLLMAKAVEIIKAHSSGTKIIISATIAPNSLIFGDGAGLNFDAYNKRQWTETIKMYLENAVRFARGENLPVADAYHASLGKDGKGLTKYIQDGIHPSGLGGELFAKKIVEAIVKHSLL